MNKYNKANIEYYKIYGLWSSEIGKLWELIQSQGDTIEEDDWYDMDDQGWSIPFQLVAEEYYFNKKTPRKWVLHG